MSIDVLVATKSAKVRRKHCAAGKVERKRTERERFVKIHAGKSFGVKNLNLPDKHAGALHVGEKSVQTDGKYGWRVLCVRKR